MKAERHHQQQERAVDFEEAATELRSQPQVQQSRDPGPNIEPRAALTARQQQPARRPGVVRVLAANRRKQMREEVQHWRRCYFTPVGSFAGTGIGTLVTFQLGWLRSTRKRAQSDGLIGLSMSAR